jgi:hypothetical protein
LGEIRRLENAACDRALTRHDLEAGRSLDGCSPTATTGFDSCPDSANNEK